LKRWLYVVIANISLVMVAALSLPLRAQSNAPGTLEGSVTDPKGQAVSGAVVTVQSESKDEIHKGATNGEGRFVVTGLIDGEYSVTISSSGFAPAIRNHVRVGADATPALSITLSVASVAEEVTVTAEDVTSEAAQLSPVKAMLDAGSARTEISNSYIRQFTSPVTDFTDIMQAAPGTFSVSPNGVGLGQSNTYYRGFADGDYTITYDGIPFEDTNSPTHHSWAFFPGPTIGGVDFDRSPGTASDIGPTNFGGSIHLLSPQLPIEKGYKLDYSYGSFNTQLIDGQYNSGLVGPGKKANLWFEGNHLSSDGYETFNYQRRTAGALKFNYKFSEKTMLSLFSSVVILDSNTPNASPTRAQIAQYGDNYLLDGTQYVANGNLDPNYYRYFFYHVPTDFEYAGLTSDLGHGWKLDTKAYTYSYYNHQHYNGSGTKISATSATDKLNSYNRLGDTLTVSQASKYGVFRAGLWYEWSYTNRYQTPTNPTDWIDQTVPNFHEQFWTNSVQPFAEYQYVAIPKLTITLGIKDAYYNMSLKQYADNGKIVGSLNGAPYVTNDAGYNSWLPSFEANYRVRPNWSVYGQFGQGSIIPPSSVFDVTNAEVKGLPNPTKASTYQGGTVLKYNHLSLDADGYYIRFQNAYSSFTPTSGPNEGITYEYLSPDSRTKGFEAEGNLYLAHGLSVFLNGTVTSAKYVAAAAQAATSTTPAIAATPVAWVASTPHDTESEGITYQDRHWDMGFFNKRIGSQWNDNGSVHQAVPINSFSISNLFLNYTLHNGSRFDESKVRLSFNNLFDNHNVTAITPANPATATTPFAENGADTLTLVPGRSVMVTFQMGFGPKGR
jgi:iron complex outermembrane recepter protein